MFKIIFLHSGAGPECFYPAGTDTSTMALATQNMDGTSNEIDYKDIFGTIRAGKGDWDGSIIIDHVFALSVFTQWNIFCGT